ncbi:MAG TPA: hypothetical protein DCX14_12360 [Flavobacteriales bacterium]|jgi:hypothetical protein|nr:hypothetical protein [Flavobacteriales bacterium]HAW20967.1 hypothetical protein [Flavobacteriales bacterium]
MKNRLRFISISLLLVVLLASTGYVREFLFVNINEQLSFLWYGHETSNMSRVLSFLDGFDYWTIYYLKWALTGVFSVIYLIETTLALKYLFNSFYARESVFLYAALIVVSTILFVGYSAFDNAEDGYLLSRFFMGLAQSPVPLMILIPAIFLRTNSHPAN